MSRTVVTFVLIAFASTAFGGCLDAATGGSSGVAKGHGKNALPAVEVAPKGLDGYEDFQLMSHPAYGWPTVNNMGKLAGSWDVLAKKPLPVKVTGLTHLAHVDGGKAGSGIAVWGTYAFNSGGGGGNPGTIVDIRDPTHPVVVATMDDAPYTRDADIMAFPDGRILLVTATNKKVDPIWDVTDPHHPFKVTDIVPSHGSHNIAVVPGTPLLYNANSAGGDGTNGVTEIWDLSQPDTPVLVKDWINGFGCHDITFYINPHIEKYRAYCAGVAATQIWDIKDPKNPTIVTNVQGLALPVPEGRGVPKRDLLIGIGGLHHLAMVNHDASILIVGDETMGGSGPGCDAGVNAAGRRIDGPIGNLWFFDIKDEHNPRLLSWISPNAQLANAARQDGGTINCTAHFGRLVEDRNQVVMAFYGAGVVLVDFSDPNNPQILDNWNQGTNTWDVWYYQGYAISGDLSRGMDIFSFR